MLKYFPVAANSLIRHKLRSSLSVLGIIFGVGAVIVALAIGEGARRELQESIALLGSNNLTVRSRGSGDRSIAGGMASDPHLAPADLARIEQKLYTYLAALAPLKYRPASIGFKTNTIEARLVGTTPAFLRALDLKVSAGRFLADADLNNGQRICVLGQAVKQALFPIEDPIGKEVKSGSESFLVVGWLERKALPQLKDDAFKLADLNRDVYIPLTTAYLSMPGGEVLDEIVVRSHEETGLVEVAATIGRILGSAEGEKQGVGFEIIIPGELLRQGQRLRRIFNTVMAGIAAISLLVGGIGIMNIMLATVSERTREIGIRRALGASRQEIIRQFLAEAMLLTLAGGLAGIVAGITAAMLVGAALHWRVGISLVIILLASLISISIGIIFGLYPAYRAARLNPVAALRHE